LSNNKLGIIRNIINRLFGDHIGVDAIGRKAQNKQGNYY
jgi:hypothetical protein